MRYVPTRASGPPGCGPSPLLYAPGVSRGCAGLSPPPSVEGALPWTPCCPVWTLLPQLLSEFLAQVSGDPRSPPSEVMLNQLLKGSETQFPLMWNQDNCTSCAGVAQ